MTKVTLVIYTSSVKVVTELLPFLDRFIFFLSPERNKQGVGSVCLELSCQFRGECSALQMFDETRLSALATWKNNKQKYSKEQARKVTRNHLLTFRNDFFLRIKVVTLKMARMW